MLEGEQRHELIVLDLAAIIRVDLGDEPLNINRHLDLRLNDID